MQAFFTLLASGGSAYPHSRGGRLNVQEIFTDLAVAACARHFPLFA
jgi:hypothetical protein